MEETIRSLDEIQEGLISQIAAQTNRLVALDKHQFEVHRRNRKYEKRLRKLGLLSTLPVKSSNVSTKKRKQLMKCSVDFSTIKWHQNEIVMGPCLSKPHQKSGCIIRKVYVDGFACAMKELKLKDVATEKFEAVKQELSILQRLPPHQNITRYLYHCVTEDLNFLRMFTTLYDCSLYDFIQQKRQVSEYFQPSTIARFMLMLINGVRFLHNNAIIHRDINSANIFVMLDQHNQVNNLAVGDFDHSMRQESSSAPSSSSALDLYSHHSLVGTSGWIAPECIIALDMNATAGDDDQDLPSQLLHYQHNPTSMALYTPKSDVFSVGMVLYELLSLRRPFEESAHFEISDKIVCGQRPHLPKQIVQDPRYANLCQVFKLCTSLLPKNRPSLSELESFFLE